jgi:uncharacterized protein YcfJ
MMFTRQSKTKAIALGQDVSDGVRKMTDEVKSTVSLGLERFSSIQVGLNARTYAGAVCSSLARGHGVMAEKASHLIDLAKGADVQHVGHTNALNGADRIVDGILIQTKYCSSGGKCVASCFDPGGFRYMSNGMPMQIEVPKDFHADAVKAMEVRIARGQVAGVTDKAEASNLVRKGHLTYEQAVNLGKAGTIESVVYDAATGTVVAGCAFGLSSAARFAMGVWSGEDLAVAAAAAFETGLSVGGMALLTSVASAQLARTSFDRALVPISQAAVEAMGPELVKTLAAAFGKEGLRGVAAERFVGRILRGNMVTTVATAGVMASVDAWRLATGRITAGQAGRSITVRTASTAAGTLGWITGSAHGALIGSVVPGIGTGAGALIGGLVGSVGAGGIAGKTMEKAIDATFTTAEDRLRASLVAAIAAEIDAHLLGEAEATELADRLAAWDISQIEAAVDPFRKRIVGCRHLAAPMALEIASRRSHVSLPAREAA